MSVVESHKPLLRRIFYERQRNTSLPLYYENFLWITNSLHEEYERYWVELRGTTLFLYTNDREEMYIKKIDLVSLVALDVQHTTERPCQQFILTLPNETLYLMTNSSEEAEEWKGFILTVTELSVPCRLLLLPGQTIKMKETLENERVRRASCPDVQPLGKAEETEDPTNEDYIDVISAVPSCFYHVTRKEAADMLENSPSNGNLILRPCGDSKNYSVTIQEPLDSPSIKHYKVLRKGGDYYTIELEKPVTLKGLDKVVEYFISETRGRLKPFISHEYQTHLDTSLLEQERKAHIKTLPQMKVAPVVRSVLEGTARPFRKNPANIYVNTNLDQELKNQLLKTQEKMN
ncbi:LOW QUALITY PROTEIN: signal-transducing adaptor protein 1-like [Microcaecilia unicolor]|uniref:LOW QUALITY PROTEIN: signal-transducing adaptor protein 1-like n=1 Tax=Microcaecilia unicolor TaxID=1415580 RepID=A0A6P7X712_9AMPH|nr:LOW QUALITY PROTEIN: signal-transducing adaptor protein 1-like [Microcaecilia unicolor]